MSRDDYISKLFIKNQDKLGQAPSSELWSRLEVELDKKAPLTASVRRYSWAMYMAAASVLFMVVIAALQWQKSKLPSLSAEQNKPLALNTVTEPFEEVQNEPYEELLQHTEKYQSSDLAIAEKEEQEIRAQEQRIVEAVQKRLKATVPVEKNTVSTIAINDIIVADEVAFEEIELIEPLSEQRAASDKLEDKRIHVDFYQNNQPIAPELNYNNTIVPQVANTIDNNAEVESIINRATQESATIPTEPLKKSTSILSQNSVNRPRSIVKKSSKVERIKSPMANAHPKLYPLGFLLGRWEDIYESEGNSYEIWKLKGKNALVGRGYKLSKDGERIFEERLRIEYRDNQIFLAMSFDENKRQVYYMLTSFGQERFVFEHKERGEYPNKIILQQDGIQGYTITIGNTNNLLTANQQRYLEHRNRVSNVRAIRTLHRAN